MSPRRPIRRASLAFGVIALALTAASGPHAQQQSGFDGVSNSLETLYRVSNAKTRSISPENLTGGKGEGGMATTGSASNAARDLGQGWKVNPFIVVPARTTFTLGEIAGSGAIQHIWMTPSGHWRRRSRRRWRGWKWIRRRAR